VWRSRRHREQPVVLPSLDRLSGLVERVVELVDAVADPTPVPAPEPVPEPPRDAPESPRDAPEPVTTAVGWVAFVSSPQGYRLVEAGGSAPEPGAAVELEGAPHRVLKVGPSPLPGDRRRCVYVTREEAPPAERTSDA
jgi:hypothetical protein